MHRGKLLFWSLGMLLIPPITSVPLMIATNSVPAGAALYLLLMIGLGVSAAFSCATRPQHRVILSICLPVGMLVVQCAVLFAGCSLLISSYH